MKKYNKYGILFVMPYIAIYTIFTIVPLISSLYKSFFVNYWNGLKEIGPIFNGFNNYLELINNSDLPKYFFNTIIMWLLGFVPQIVLSLLFSAWFSNHRLNLRGSNFFKTIIYFPNLIMAASLASLFFSFFSDLGPINTFLIEYGFIKEPIKFFSTTAGVRALIAFMNCLMWFGNTTLLLLAGILNVDSSVIEAAEVDGASSIQIFTKITIPIIKPILVYVMITSLIGGLQMFDVPQVLTEGTGNPMRNTMTLLMFLNKHMFSKNYGIAGALSIMLFAVTAIMSVFVFAIFEKDKEENYA